MNNILDHSKEQLKSDLVKLGITEGDSVLVHSSYRSLGGIEGGAKAFFKAFIELLGPEGTLLIPALSYDLVTEDYPIFDVRKTSTCIGYLPEFFRTQVPGVIRSLHPTHSCCMKGKYAKELALDHEKDDTPVGKNSPFAKLPKIGGKILMLGCPLECNTSMHGVEETVVPPYLFGDEQRINYILYDEKNKVYKQHALRHSFNWNDTYYDQRYERIVPLLSHDEKANGQVLSADAWLMSASAVWKKGHEKLLENPLYFVNPIKEDYE